MKNRFNGSVPWDIAVFLIVTVVGFGYTIENFSRRHPGAQAARVQAPALSPAVGLLDLGCLDEKPATEKFLRESGPLRVKGRLCRIAKGDNQVEGIRVKNLSNGHEATVYFQGYDSSFVTDYINMNSGKNSLEIRWIEPGTVEKTLVSEVFER